MLPSNVVELGTVRVMIYVSVKFATKFCAFCGLYQCRRKPDNTRQTRIGLNPGDVCAHSTAKIV